jgi:putative nucleotidyltransferase with HDIG domain
MNINPEAIEFVPFRVSTLRGDQKIDFNAYVKINNKFILYVRQGDSFEGKRIGRLKEKKLKQLFLRPEEEHLYRTYLERNIEMAYNKNSGKTIENRVEIIQGSQQSNVEEVFENPFSVSAYTEAKTSAEKFANFLQSEEQAFSTLMNLQNVDQNIAHHGVTVASISSMLANKINTFDPKSINLMTLGALFHDFDHHHNGLKLNQPLSSFTPAEMEKYKNHPRAGANAVQDKKHFDSLVIKIILEHEERIDGSGFPSGLREKDLDPASVIVGLCNALDRLITFEGFNKSSAFKELMINKVGKYPIGHFKILGEIMAKIQ